MIVKSDASIKSVAVYDVSGKALKTVNGIQGLNGAITISGLPKNQVLIVRATMGDGSIMNYKLFLALYVNGRYLFPLKLHATPTMALYSHDES